VDRYIKNFMKYKGLLYELVMRDIKIKYRRSFLGILWSLLNPLLMMIVITIVFSNLFKFKIQNFAVYLLTGQIIFTFFSEATSTAMSSILSNGSLIKKIYIPKYIFPVSRGLSSFVNLLFSLIAIVIMLIVTKQKISWTIILFPIPLIYLLIFAIGIGLILSAFAVFFRDLLHLYGVMLIVWNYMTPIIYPEDIVPLKYKFIFIVNPLYYIIKYFREVVLYAQIPSLKLNIICLGISLFTLLIGMIVFYRKQDEFILYI
jgi:ABC-2 type transport system permease protein